MGLGVCVCVNGNRITIRMLGVTRDSKSLFSLAFFFGPLLPFVLAANSSPTRQRAPTG